MVVINNVLLNLKISPIENRGNKEEGGI